MGCRARRYHSTEFDDRNWESSHSLGLIRVTNDESYDVQSEKSQEDNGLCGSIEANYEEREMEERKDNRTPE